MSFALNSDPIFGAFGHNGKSPGKGESSIFFFFILFDNGDDQDVQDDLHLGCKGDDQNDLDLGCNGDYDQMISGCGCCSCQGGGIGLKSEIRRG